MFRNHRAKTVCHIWIFTGPGILSVIDTNTHSLDCSSNCCWVWYVSGIRLVAWYPQVLRQTGIKHCEQRRWCFHHGIRLPPTTYHHIMQVWYCMLFLEINFDCVLGTSNLWSVQLSLERLGLMACIPISVVPRPHLYQGNHSIYWFYECRDASTY